MREDLIDKENDIFGSDSELPNDTDDDQKSNLQFMQKYYHTGIFGDRSDPIFNRDYNIGVGTDNYDKSSLP